MSDDIQEQWTALTGDFEAQSLVTGETVRASKAFLPGSVQDAIVAQISKNAVGVEFAFIIGIAKDETTAIGFIYTVKAVRSAAVLDPLGSLRKLMRAAAPQVIALADPKKADTKKIDKK